MIGFNDLIDKLTLTDAGYVSDITDDWRQGRTAYGGVTTGLSYAVAMKVFPDLPLLKSLQITFIGPVVSNPVFKASLLRKGRNVTSVRVDAFCDDAIVSSGLFIFSKARESTVFDTIIAPQTPPPDMCEPFTQAEAKTNVPSFFHRFDTKLIEGGRPGSNAKTPHIRAWSRHADPGSRNGIASFLTLGDVLPPAVLPTLKKLGPISSVNWQMNILADPITYDGWWHIETKQSAAQDGYSSQPMRFWNSDGDLVAEGLQSVAVFV